MVRHRSRLHVGLLAALPALVLGCASSFQAANPALVGNLSNAKTIAFAYDLTDTCKLESLPGDASPAAGAAWSKLAGNELAGSEVAVLDKRTSEATALVRILLVKEPTGKRRWLRNVPATSAAEVAQRWACAVDTERLARSAKAIQAETVRIVPGAPTCAGVTPILGEVGDVTLDPYTITGRRLFNTRAGLALGVTLQTADAERALTVLGSDLDTCFAVTRRAATAASERTEVLRWLGDPSAAPPAVDVQSYRQITGLDDKACLSEGEGVTKHDECRAAVFGTARDGSGASGTRLLFFRERVADAVHAYGGKLAPAEELAGVNVVMRQIQARDDASFGGAFAKTLVASLLDPAKQRARSAHGYRLIRPQETAAGTTANANLDVDVVFAMPKLETQQQDRRQRRARGRTQVPNPDRLRAARRLESARADLRSSEVEAAVYDKLFDAPLPRCTAGAPSCDVAAKRGLGAARVTKRRERVAVLETAMAAVPETVEQDDIVAVDYRARVYRRQGEATVTFKLAPTDALPGTPAVQLTRKVPFDASEVEIAAAPGIEAKAAKAPEREQVEAAIANAVLTEVDAILSTWMRRATAAAPPASFELGSRAQLALLARYTASNRRVRLVSDLIEDRPDRLAARGEYPITVPPGADRCYTFVATPLRHGGDANLTLRARPSNVLAARDARTAPEAGFDVCPLAPGSYTLELTSASAVPVALAMFESTPGVSPDPDYGAAMPKALGEPRPPLPATPSPSALPKR